MKIKAWPKVSHKTLLYTTITLNNPSLQTISGFLGHFFIIIKTSFKLL